MNYKKISRKQEKSVADEVEGKTVIASGALWGFKGDVRTDKWLIECKTTEKDYYTVTAKVWEKIAKEALKDHCREPMLVIDLHNNPKERYVCFWQYLIDMDHTPGWLLDRIEYTAGEGSQFRFYGIPKHSVSMVSFLNSKKSAYHSVVIMRMKDFIRYDKEVLHYGFE